VQEAARPSMTFYAAVQIYAATSMQQLFDNVPSVSGSYLFSVDYIIDAISYRGSIPGDNL